MTKDIISYEEFIETMNELEYWGANEAIYFFSSNSQDKKFKRLKVNFNPLNPTCAPTSRFNIAELG